MLHLAGTTRSDDRNTYFFGKTGEGFVGESLFYTVVIHTGEENLTCTTVGHFLCPVEQAQFYSLSSAFHVAMPAVWIEAGINGAYTDLRTVMVGNLVDELGMSDGSTVDAYLVGSCIEESFHVLQLVDAAAHSEWDVDFGSHASYHVCKGLALFEAGGDVEEHEFVGTCIAIGLSQFHRVASTSQVYEVGSLHGFSVLHVETGNDSLCQAFAFTLNFDHCI